MSIKINDNTITGDIYYNDIRVQKVYINDELVWEGLPENNISIVIHWRSMGEFPNVVNQFRVALTAAYPVASDITVNVQYHTSGASTTVTIYKNEKYGYTGWIEGGPNTASITGVSPQRDSTYLYTYNNYGYIVDTELIINSLVTAEAIRYWSTPNPIPDNYTLIVESQYPVGNWSVSAYFNLSSTLTSVGVTLRNTKSITRTEEGAGKNASKCEWVKITQPSSSETGYYYIQGPTKYRTIRVY